MLRIFNIRNFGSSILSNRIGKRSISYLDINDNERETIYTRGDYPLDKCRKIIGNRTISILGYGPQDRGQALNLRDNGFNVVLGLRPGGSSRHTALKDGWEPTS